MKLFYTDNQVDVIRKVNLLLKEHRLWFEDDNKEHDEYIVYTLKQHARCSLCNHPLSAAGYTMDCPECDPGY